MTGGILIKPNHNEAILFIRYTKKVNGNIFKIRCGYNYIDDVKKKTLKHCQDE